jgi:hypothetical protein
VRHAAIVNIVEDQKDRKSLLQMNPPTGSLPVHLRGIEIVNESIVHRPLPQFLLAHDPNLALLAR